MNQNYEEKEYEEKEKELIECLLGLNKQSTGRQSTFQLALQNANSNKIIGNDFVSLLLHLIALEQVGNLFCKTNGTDTNGISKAIKEFSNVKFSNIALEGIKHLRHSLAHNYSLAIVDHRSSKHYKYILHYHENNNSSYDKSEYYIIPPISEWDGTLADSDIEKTYNCKMNINTSFRIFVPSLIELSEKITDTLRQKYQKGELHFVCNKENKDLEFLGQIAYKFFVYS